MREAIAKIKYVRYSDKKLRLRAKALKGMRALDALYLMRYEGSKAGKIIFDSLKSALGNAVNNLGIPAEKMFVKEISIQKGPSLKRIIARGRGRVDRMLRPMSHVFVTLIERIKMTAGALAP